MRVVGRRVDLFIVANGTRGFQGKNRIKSEVPEEVLYALIEESGRQAFKNYISGLSLGSNLHFLETRDKSVE